MPGLMRRLSAFFAIGMFVGIIALLLLPSPPPADRLAMATTPIPDPPSPPCGLQTWPNIDRDCLSWTSSRSADIRASEPARPATAAAAETTAVAKLAASAAGGEAAIAPSEEARKPAPRKPRRRVVKRGPIPVTVTRPDGTTQRIVVRPTSTQDFFFYAR